MKGFEVPADVAEAVCQRWPYRGPAWRAVVGDELAELCSRYKARPVAIMRARYGFVLAVDAPLGPLVFRGSPDPDAKGQAKVAEALADLGIAPILHDVFETVTSIWTVMARVTPGIPLAELSPAAVIPEVLAEVLRLLIRGPRQPLSDLPSITDWLQSRLVDDNLADLAPGRTVAPKSQRNAALLILDELANCPSGLCHGDASTRNILTAGDGRFQLIDPRGMVGDPVYDVAVVAIKIGNHVPMERAAKIFSRELNIDQDHLNSWMRVAEVARV